MGVTPPVCVCFCDLPKRYRKQAHHLFATALEQNSYKDAKKMLQEFERWLRDTLYMFSMEYELCPLFSHSKTVCYIPAVVYL